ncbi:hypothetical protein [Chelatococcus sp. XZ-Ab1]|uniref:hypothetical protein n=1 Tax=Chelatococcus sp. XZ-Ab1 TaxID=3034027 RepID=UPI0023E40E54|nr:hypothetical protein [Chelatococcus sp. XZ-Ab1]
MTITATDIRHGLLKHFAPPAHRVFFEVSNDTGAKARRWIDAVAVGIWPSTGHEIIGIEIKVSRGDWKRELAAPEKAQSLMRFCTRWYLACPDGLVKPDELPGTWGMLVQRDDGSMRIKVRAPKLDPEPLTPGFMMAVLRNCSAVDMELVGKLAAEKVAAREKQIDALIEREAQRRVQDVGMRQRRVLEISERLKAMTGEDPGAWSFDDRALAAAYQFFRRSRAHDRYGFGGNDLPGAINGLEQASTLLKELYEHPLMAAIRSDLAEGKEHA